MLKLTGISHFGLLILSFLLVNSALAATVTLPRTGQTTCTTGTGTYIPCAGTGQDGDNLKGAALPVPRFTDNSNGTVTDNLTGLIWLQDAGCLGINSWTGALIEANELKSGDCGLHDGSTVGQWRLPNINELESLVDINKAFPSLPTGHPFKYVKTNGRYWSSTSVNSVDAWYVGMSGGYVDYEEKRYGSGYYIGDPEIYILPVRAGQ